MNVVEYLIELINPPDKRLGPDLAVPDYLMNREQVTSLREMLRWRAMNESQGLNPDGEKKYSREFDLLNALYGPPGGSVQRQDDLLMPPRGRSKW